jgi:F420-non-reducing hydrogenase iron-sulfur subunit
VDLGGIGQGRPRRDPGDGRAKWSTDDEEGWNVSESVVVGFVCRWVTDKMDEKLRAFNANGARVYQLNCVGNVPPLLLVNAFSKGADVVFLLGCGNGNCRYYNGTEKIKNTQSGTSVMVEDLGIEPERVVVSFVEENEEDPLARVVNECKVLAGRLGPSPFRS